MSSVTAHRSKATAIVNDCHFSVLNACSSRILAVSSCIQADLKSRGINPGVERPLRQPTHDASIVNISATKRSHPIYMPIPQLHSRHMNGMTKLEPARSPPKLRDSLNPLPPASLYQTSHIPISPDVPDDLHPPRQIQIACLGRKQQHFLFAPQAPGQNRDIPPALAI